jgi:hypothetical protein
MTTERLLERLCRRHGVPLANARRLLPLVERAVRSSGELRRRLIEVIEASLARDAEELAQQSRSESCCLIAVASALHRWSEGDEIPPVQRGHAPE